MNKLLRSFWFRMAIKLTFFLGKFKHMNFRIFSMWKLKVQLMLDLNLIDPQISFPKNAMKQSWPIHINKITLKF
jgi:hypothetical protein